MVLSESRVRPSAPGEVRNGAEYGEREIKGEEIFLRTLLKGFYLLQKMNVHSK